MNKPGTVTASDNVIIDTNVIIEAVSAELLKYAEEKPPLDLLRCPKFRVRQLRTRYSLLAVWHIAETGQRGLSLRDEIIPILRKRIPPKNDGDATALTEVIVHRVVGDLGRLEWLQSSGNPKGNAADAWLVRQAAERDAPLLTNEGVTATDIRDRKPSGKTIRVRAKKAGVPVFAPVEYLVDQGVDHAAGSVRFLAAVRERLLAAPAPGERPLHPEKAERLYSLYRFILFDELAPPESSVERPLIPWELRL